jgi:hypothetical protein
MGRKADSRINGVPAVKDKNPFFDIHVTVHRRCSEVKEQTRYDKVFSFIVETCWGNKTAYFVPSNRFFTFTTTFLFVTLAPFTLLLIPKEQTNIQAKTMQPKCLCHFLLTIKHGYSRLEAHVCIFISSIHTRGARKQHFNIQPQFQSHYNEVNTQLIHSCIRWQGSSIVVACCVMSRRTADNCTRRQEIIEDSSKHMFKVATDTQV